MTLQRTTVGILVGGGPAPGINSVISAVTIRSILGGCDVIGIIDGFKWLMEGSTSQVRPLSIEEVSRIHFQGGSYLATSRANPRSVNAGRSSSGQRVWPSPAALPRSSSRMRTSRSAPESSLGAVPLGDGA